MPLPPPPFCARNILLRTEPVPLPIQAYAPEFARRLALILRALAALIARRLLGHPRLAGFIVPLWRHLSRTVRRAQSLARLLAAGRMPPPPRLRASKRSGRALFPANPRILIAALGHEGATAIAQLEALLAEAAAAALLARVPAAARLLRPLRRLLNLPAPPAPQRPAASAPPPTAPFPVAAPAQMRPPPPLPAAGPA